jgi:hypothetical protein
MGVGGTQCNIFGPIATTVLSGIYRSGDSTADKSEKLLYSERDIAKI